MGECLKERTVRRRTELQMVSVAKHRILNPSFLQFKKIGNKS